jgi:hypothetical protein
VDDAGGVLFLSKLLSMYQMKDLASSRGGSAGEHQSERPPLLPAEPAPAAPVPAPGQGQHEVTSERPHGNRTRIMEKVMLLY